MPKAGGSIINLCELSDLCGKIYELIKLKDIEILKQMKPFSTFQQRGYINLKKTLQFMRILSI